MDADRLIGLLGRHSTDPLVESVFVELRTRRRPELDPEDRDAVRDWVLVRREGVEIGVADEAYFEAAPAWRRRRKGVPLIVCQIYFYTARDDIADFKGALPFGLTWRDSRAEARRKLQMYDDRRRSCITDTWDVPGHRMTVEYKKGDKSIASVLCQLLVKPWPEKGRRQPSLKIADWMSLFGEPQSSPALRRQLRPLDLAARLEEEDEKGEVEFLRECGLQLYFTERRNLKRIRMAARGKKSDLVFGAVEFFRGRVEDAREWTGELPVGLTFDDTQLSMTEKVGREPDEQKDERFTGIARWHFPELSLEVMYDNIENELVRISLMAPGFRSQNLTRSRWMQLDEEQYAELIDRVVDEGEPELIVGPVKAAPVDLPPLWTQALTGRDPVAAVAQLWKPMESRLPRVYQAMRERLRGIGLLRTEEREVSLLYFFADEDSVFAFRGYPALANDTLEASALPAEFLDFYRIHDGWVSFHSEDGGPLPMAEWLPLSEVWEDVTLKLPPGDGSAETLLTVFRDGPELALMYDTSSSPMLPLRCRSDGSVDVLLDIWISMDREIGEFLEELSTRPGGDRASLPSSADGGADAERQHQELLARVAQRRPLAAHFGGGGVHEQICDRSLDWGRLARRVGGQREKVVDYYRQALTQFCASVELGGDVSPEEILDWFGIAHALGDVATAHFVATIPTSIWADDSLEALQARTLFCLFLGDVDHAKEFVDEILGLTLANEDDEPDLEAEITTRILQALTESNTAAFAESRKRASEELAKGRAQQSSLFPWSLRLSGFDAVARTIGLALPGSTGRR